VLGTLSTILCILLVYGILWSMVLTLRWVVCMFPQSFGKLGHIYVITGGQWIRGYIWGRQNGALFPVPKVKKMIWFGWRNVYRISCKKVNCQDTETPWSKWCSGQLTQLSYKRCDRHFVNQTKSFLHFRHRKQSSVLPPSIYPRIHWPPVITYVGPIYQMIVETCKLLNAK